MPPGRYTIEVEPINPIFEGSSSVGPVSPPVAWSSPPEFYSGPDESAHDDPLSRVEVEVIAGAVVTGVNIILNATLPSPSNDLCLNAKLISEPVFGDVIDTGAAAVSGEDPTSSCSPGRSRNVWYRFRAPSNGTVTVDSYGSNFDTLIAAYRGACGGLVEVGCNDNSSYTSRGWIAQSQLSFNVVEGQESLIEIAAASNQQGRSVLNMRFRFAAAIGGPDLTLSELRVSSSTLKLGATATVSFTILNQGDHPSDPSELELRLASRNYRVSIGDLLATQAIDSLAPGEARRYEVNIVLPDETVAGTQFIGIIVDPKNRISESIEGNNIITAFFNLVER